MPEYRAYVLDEHDHILFPIEIVEEDLSAAVPSRARSAP